LAAPKRIATVRRVIGRKIVRDKVYVYEYYTLPLNLYIPKSMVEKWGKEFIIERNEESGVIRIVPKKLME